MSKKPISQKRAERQQMENQALHRVFNVFLLGLAAECYLFIVQRFYTASTVSSLLLWDRILRWGVWLGLVMLFAGVMVAVVKRNQARLRTAMTWVAGIGAFLAVSGWVITRFFDQNRGITAMCIAVPVLTLLGLVYFLFQHECFATTVILTGSLFSVWVCGNGVSGTWRVPVIVCAVLVVIALVVLAGLIRRVQTEGGKLGGLRVFTPECDYRVLYAACAAGALSIVVTLLLPAASFYLLWVLGILLFAALVYFTTKLM